MASAEKVRSDTLEINATAWSRTCALAGLGAIVSIVGEGFRYGVVNNIFHIPIVLKLFDLPQFSQDPFYQSLRNFTSFVWPGLALIATPANVAAVFLGAHILSRLLLYLACIRCLMQMGLRSRLGLLVSVLVLAAGSSFTGYAPISLTGLQIDYFTHTELTYPFVIFSLMMAVERRYLVAFVINGLTFNINAFVGIWLIVVLAVMVLVEPENMQRKIKTLALSGIAQILISFPTAAWILGTIRNAHGAPSFDYRAFLAYYFPKHFFIQASNLHDIVQFGMVCVSGLIALRVWGRTARPWGVAFAGCVALFGAGCLLPLISSSRLLLNLLVLRIDGVATLLVLLFVLCVACPELIEQRWGTALALIAALWLGDWRATAFASTLFALERGSLSRKTAVLLCFAMGGLSVASQVGSSAVFQTNHLMAASLCFVLAFLAEKPELLALGALIATFNFPILAAGAVIATIAIVHFQRRAPLWVLGLIGLCTLLQMSFGELSRTALFSSLFTLACASAPVVTSPARLALSASLQRNTLAAVFSFFLAAVLLSYCRNATNAWVWSHRGPQAAVTDGWKDVQQWVRTNTPESAKFLVPSQSSGFELGSYRQVWIDWQQGAAVMWSPAYYSRWMARFPEVNNLTKHVDYYQYALEHRIEYYVVPKSSGRCDACLHEMLIFNNGEFEVYRVTPAGDSEPRAR